MIKQLTLSFKGSRSYLHGSDFFNLLAQIGPEITGNDAVYIEHMSFHKISRNQCDLVTAPPHNADATIGNVRFKSVPDGACYDCWIIETDRSVTSRNAFDEQSIIEKIIFNAECSATTLQVEPSSTFIEDVIILTKTLNYGISSEIDGIWMFARIDLLEKPSDNYKQLTVSMQRMVAGKFSVNDILADGHKIGQIQFIVGND